MNPISSNQLVQQLRELGVQPGGVLLVHTAYSQIRPVEGGPSGLIDALRRALGSAGTLVMPSMTWDDDHPFDPLTTPCLEMGIVADTFWRQPGVLRSDSPHAFAASGPMAGRITAPHPIDLPHGLDSPAGRVYELDGQVLLLGVGQDASTTIHLGENLAGVRYRRETGVMILQKGRPTRLKISEVDHCCRNFALVDDWLDEKQLLRRGIVGRGPARLARSHDIIAVVLDHLLPNETAFLHPPGVDEACDEAWASLLA